MTMASACLAERTGSLRARVAVLALATAVVLPGSARAQQGAGAADEAPQAGSGFDLAYVPTDAAGVLAIRPGAVLEQPKLKEWIGGIGPLAEFTKRAGVGLEQIDSITIVVYPGMPPIDGPAAGEAVFATMAGVIVRAKQPTDWKAAIGRLAPDPRLVFSESRYAGKPYYRLATGEGPEMPIVPALYVPDERTMVFAAEANLFRSIQRGNEPATGYVWDAAWQRTSPGADVVAAVDVGWLRSLFNRLGPRPGRMGAAEHVALSTVAPVWEQATAVTAAVDLQSGIDAGITITCADEEGAAGAAETLKALWVLARNTTKGFDRALASAPPEAQEVLTPLANEVRRAVAGASVASDGPLVQFAIRTDVPLEQWIDNVLRLHAERHGAGPATFAPQDTREQPAQVKGPRR
jgi:hypothetical protein